MSDNTAGVVIALIAIAIGAVSLITTVVIFRRQTDSNRDAELDRKTAEYVDQLEARVVDLEKQNEKLNRIQREQGKELKDCQRARGELTEQNFRLYLRIDEMEATIKRRGMDI